MAGQAIALALKDFLEPALRLDLVDHALGEGGVRRGGDVGAGRDRQFRGEQVEDVGAAGRDMEFVDEGEHLAGDNVASGGEGADDIAVAVHGNVRVAVGSV